MIDGTYDYHAVVRSDLRETDPQLYQLVSNLSIDLDDMSRIMAMAEDELAGISHAAFVEEAEQAIATPNRAAQIWAKDNQATWERWVPRGFATSERSVVVEDVRGGQDVSSSLWKAVADGDADIHLQAAFRDINELPEIAKVQYAAGTIEVLDPYLRGARIAGSLESGVRSGGQSRASKTGGVNIINPVFDVRYRDDTKTA